MDSPDTIAQKIRRCKTDSFAGLEFGDSSRPECNNLLGLYQSTSGRTREEVAREVRDMRWGAFKVYVCVSMWRCVCMCVWRDVVITICFRYCSRTQS